MSASPQPETAAASPQTLPFLSTKRSPLLLALAVLAFGYVLVSLNLGYNFLAVVLIALSMGASLAITLEILFTKRLHLCLAVIQLILLVGSGLFFAVWGAEGFLKSFGYNLLLALLPLATTLFLPFTDATCRSALARRIVPLVLSVVMLGSSVFYFLAVNLRLRPTLKSMKAGQDDYLDNLGNKKQDAPNVLLILMDDMAYSDISCYSYRNAEGEAPTIQTPNIDALAADGVTFTNSYSSSPVCSPSRFGILTGRYPSRGYLDNVVFPSVVSLNPFGSTRYFNPFQFLNNVDGILGDEITIAEALGEAGYDTALFGKWNLGDYGEYLPMNQGFDYFFGSYYVNDMTPYNMVVEQDGKATEVLTHRDLLDQSETTKNLSYGLENKAQGLNDYILDHKDSEAPFFAMYATPWPHYPLFSGVRGDTTDDTYIKCIEEFDRYLGETIDLLKENGMYDNTVILFTSDNGPGREGVTGALRGRKNTTFDGGHKVPFIVTYPAGGIGAGREVDTPTMNIDLFPTLLELAGVMNWQPKDRVIDGKSLLPLLMNAPETQDADYRLHDALYFIKRGVVQGVQMPLETEDTHELHDFKYYIKVRNENSAFLDQIYRNYLFDLTLDPAEGYTVSKTYVATAEKMKAQLLAFSDELKTNRRGVIAGYYDE